MLDFENDLLVLLSDVARHMRTYGNQLARQHGVTFTQLTILARLEGESESLGGSAQAPYSPWLYRTPSSNRSA